MNRVITDMTDIAEFPATARIWIYPGNAFVPEERISEVRTRIADFAQQWTSHNRQLRATGDLLYNRFLLLMVNEMVAGVSGCSIDASVNFVRELGANLGIDFMDRLNFAYLDESDTLQFVHKDELAGLYHSGKVDDNTRFFDHLVQSKEAFEQRWLVPLGESWMKRFV